MNPTEKAVAIRLAGAGSGMAALVGSGLADSDPSAAVAIGVMVALVVTFALGRLFAPCLPMFSARKVSVRDWVALALGASVLLLCRSLAPQLYPYLFVGVVFPGAMLYDLATRSKAGGAPAQ